MSRAEKGVLSWSLIIKAYRVSWAITLIRGDLKATVTPLRCCRTSFAPVQATKRNRPNADGVIDRQLDVGPAARRPDFPVMPLRGRIGGGGLQNALSERLNRHGCPGVSSVGAAVVHVLKIAGSQPPHLQIPYCHVKIVLQSGDARLDHLFLVNALHSARGGDVQKLLFVVDEKGLLQVRNY
ncbi:MAG: hypothetical protein BJ554DRAFT_4494 [Olpidium bornovanus]|uniref:Uncharacterized protein n=1 Tax=Olpidium bornovanus TaxID=278681 RepID=A0A8H8DLU8_9FUNG|nr:MAG: hypothetical protein BJ554DRAFT_4494 [Olpidium bornovanus]